MGGRGGGDLGEITFTFVRPPDRVSMFSARLMCADAASIVLEHPVSRYEPLIVGDMEVVADGYRAVWFLFKGEPFDIARFYTPDGEWTGFYVDILEPVQWSDGDARSLQPLIDLFLDVWIAPDGQITLLDEDEFEDAASSGVLSRRQAMSAREALHRCLGAAAIGQFPPAAVRHFDSKT